MSTNRSALLERADTVGQFVVTSVDHPNLTEDDEHHLERVLRVRDGERIGITDGKGAWRIFVWTSSRLSADSETRFEPASRVPVSVGFALLKGDKTEWVVQKLTELGVDTIAPLTTARTVVNWDAHKAERNHKRLIKVAHGAAMQSRRVWLPTVLPVTTLSQAIAGGMALAHPGGGPPADAPAGIAVGPEGGFTGEELSSAALLVDLGSNILRAETASITLGVLLCARRAN